MKSVDNVVVGVGAGLATGAVSLPSGPGAFVAGTAVGLAADSAYKESGYDAEFDHFIETTLSPIIHDGVKFGVDSIESLNITTDKITDELEETVDLILDIFD